MPWVVTFSTPTRIYTVTFTMPETTPTRRRTTEERAFSAPVITGLFTGFTAILAGLAIELQGLPCCFESTLASVTIVLNNVWATSEINSSVAPPPAAQLFHCITSSINLGILLMMMILRASRPAQAEVSPLSIVGLFVLELLGLLAVGVAATLAHLEDEEEALIESTILAEDAPPAEAAPPAEEASPVEEASPAEETFPDDESTLVDEAPEEALTPEKYMQRSLALLERTEALVNTFGVSVHQLTWYADVLRGTAQDINRMFAWGWGPRYQPQEVPDEGYPGDDNDPSFLAAYREGLARQGYRHDPNAEGESSDYDDTEDEDDSEFYDDDQYSTDEDLALAIAEEIEWAEQGEWAQESRWAWRSAARAARSEDLDSDGSSMPDLVTDEGLVYL